MAHTPGNDQIISFIKAIGPGCNTQGPTRYFLLHSVSHRSLTSFRFLRSSSFRYSSSSSKSRSSRARGFLPLLRLYHQEIGAAPPPLPSRSTAGSAPAPPFLFLRRFLRFVRLRLGSGLLPGTLAHVGLAHRAGGIHSPGRAFLRTGADNGRLAACPSSVSARRSASSTWFRKWTVSSPSSSRSIIR